MSPDDISPATVAVEGLGEAFTAEEQAQFDAMQQADDGGDLQPDPAPAPPPEPAPPAPKAGDPPPAPPAEPSDDDDVEVPGPVSGKPQKRVSIHKYQRLEQRAKEAEERAEAAAKERQELLERTARADERLKIISEAMNPPAADPAEQVADDPPPDPEKDIFGYAQWQGRQIAKLNDRLNGIESGAQAQVNDQEIATTYQSDAARFAAAEPAFAEAYVYLINQRDAELQLAGVTDQRARHAQIVREEKGLVAGAISQKRSPAEVIFNMAKGRGYQPKAAPQPGAEPPAPTVDPKALDAKTPAPAPAAPPAAPAAPAKPSVTDEIEAIKRGQEAAASLSNVGGGAPLRELTSKALADMPEEEFNRLLEQLPRERQIELMGN